jgi:hypothetical protein
MPWGVPVKEVLNTSDFYDGNSPEGYCYTYSADLVMSEGFHSERAVDVSKRGLLNNIKEFFDPLNGKQYQGIKFDPTEYTGVHRLPESSTVLTDVFDRTQTALYRIPLPLTDAYILKNGLDRASIRVAEYDLSRVNLRVNELIQDGRYNSVVALSKRTFAQSVWTPLSSLVKEFTNLLAFG